MNIVTRARNFLTTLLSEGGRSGWCPHCKKSLGKRYGFYTRGRRCLDRVDPRFPIQRYQCLDKKCKKTWSRGPAWLFPRRWYGRDVIRKSLDLVLDAMTSWRELTEVLLGEITGAGRALRWAPWRRPKRGAKGIRLSHTTVWRWSRMAAERAGASESRAGRYAGLFSGVLATDESWGWVKGIVKGVGQKVSFGIQGLIDGQNRLVLGLSRLKGEAEEDLRQGFERLGEVGVELARMRLFLSDGLATYEAVLEMLNLGMVARQRSVFHLWRTIAKHIAAYRAECGDEAAKALRAGVRAVWDASSERAAVVALYALVGAYGEDQYAWRVVDFVRSTFVAAIHHLKGSVPGVGRTSNVLEWLWRRFKRRMRLAQVFMGEDGPDQFLALFELYVNFHRYQRRGERKRRYPYAGLCPLEIAGEAVEVEVNGRRRVLSWFDALEI